MTFTTMIILGITASLVVVKFAVLAFIVALAVKTFMPIYKAPAPSVAMSRLPVHKGRKPR